MKRKTKLFASIASLCLAVALMAFGVYAATSVTYKVTGTVTFESQVAVTWTGTISGGKTLPGTTTDTYKVTADGTGDQGDDTWAIGEAQFGAATTERTITYTFECTNDGSEPVHVTATLTELFGDENLTVKVKQGAKGASTVVGDAEAGSALQAQTIAVDGTYECIITVTLDDPTATVNSGNTLSLSFLVEKGAAA